MAITAFPIAEQTITTSGKVTGIGTSGNAVRLSNSAAGTVIGNLTGAAAVPIDNTIAALQSAASVDDLITLSGVAEGAANLGTFTGTTIADSLTIKAALQSLETAVEAGGTAKAHDSLTSGTVLAQVARLGGTTTVLSNPATGVWKILVPALADAERISVFATNAHVGGDNSLTIQVDNAANARDRRVTVDVFAAATGTLQDVFNLGMVPTVTYTANVSNIYIPDFGGFGATGAWVEIR
jgi:hypothetical protein